MDQLVLLGEGMTFERLSEEPETDPEFPKNDPVPEGGVPLPDGVEPTPPDPTEEPG